MVKKNEVKRSYYLNLFSGNADITDSSNDRSFYGTNLLFSMSSQRNRKSSPLFASNFLSMM